MIMKSTILASASGSLGGLCFQRSRAGMVVKARHMPCNKLSQSQTLYRLWFSRLSTFWLCLTEPERSSWRDYASNVSLPVNNGLSGSLSARDHFIRSNFPRQFYYTGEPIIRLAPNSQNLGACPSLQNFSCLITGFGDLQVDCFATEWDASIPNDSHSFIYMKATSSFDSSVQRCRSPFRYFQTFSIEAWDPPPVALSFNLTWQPWIVAPAEGPYLLAHPESRIFLSYAFSRSDGRLSTSSELSVLTPP